jgi:hypothetical protein
LELAELRALLQNEELALKLHGELPRFGAPGTQVRLFSVPSSLNMHFVRFARQLVTVLGVLQTASAVPFSQLSHKEKRSKPLAPKVFMINMFAPEADVW